MRTSSSRAPTRRQTIQRRPISRTSAPATWIRLEPRRFVNAGTILIVAGEYQQARTLAERALRADANSADAYILMGNALAGLKNMSRAIAQIEQAVQLDPSYAPAWTSLGAIRFRDGQRQQAGEAFRKAVELAPQSANARIALANYQWALGDTASAEATLRKTLTMDPDSSDAHRALALLYLTTKRAAQAEPHFLALAGDTRGKLALADFYLGTKQTAKAKAVLDEVTKGDNAADKRAAQLRLASMEYASGRKKRGATHHRRNPCRPPAPRRRSKCQGAHAARRRCCQGS